MYRLLKGQDSRLCPLLRELYNRGNLVSGAANAEQSAQFLEGIEAATGSPSSVKPQFKDSLLTFMSEFEGGKKPPPWASGAMRQATAIMAQRGLKATSSMAGQAIVQSLRWRVRYQ